MDKTITSNLQDISAQLSTLSTESRDHMAHALTLFLLCHPSFDAQLPFTKEHVTDRCFCLMDGLTIDSFYEG